jgi:hypothetical protein
MAQTKTDDRPLTLDDLTAYFSEGCKPKEAWRVGAEHEKFGFRLSDHSTVPYYGPDGIEALLKGLMRFGWEPVLEDRADGGQTIIGLERGKANVSLEPGGHQAAKRQDIVTLDLRKRAGIDGGVQMGIGGYKPMAWKVFAARGHAAITHATGQRRGQGRDNIR